MNGKNQFSVPLLPDAKQLKDRSFYVMVPISQLNSIATKISCYSFHSASNKVFFYLKSQHIKFVKKRVSNKIALLVFFLTVCLTSRVSGGDESQASSSTCAKSTFRGRNMMMFGVMD